MAPTGVLVQDLLIVPNITCKLVEPRGGAKSFNKAQKPPIVPVGVAWLPFPWLLWLVRAFWGVPILLQTLSAGAARSRCRLPAQASGTVASDSFKGDGSHMSHGRSSFHGRERDIYIYTYIHVYTYIYICIHMYRGWMGSLLKDYILSFMEGVLTMHPM